MTAARLDLEALPELLTLPPHPEPHTHTWTEMEKRCILAWGAELVQAADKAATERAAKAVEALRDDHCKSTQGQCTPTDLACDFVVAWNDAAAAIREAK